MDSWPQVVKTLAKKPCHCLEQLAIKALAVNAAARVKASKIPSIFVFTAHQRLAAAHCEAARHLQQTHHSVHKW